MYSTSLYKQPATTATTTEYAVNPLANNFNPYAGYYVDHHRRRLSSTGEGSGDSSTTTSGSSSNYGERDEGSEGRAESESTESGEREEREPLQGELSEAERHAVESFFSGLKTQVFVCSSLANLYSRPNNDNSEWELCFTGIPVVLLDIGEAKSRDKRKIQIILAERGTSFMLWRDTIDNLTSYKVSGNAFHTMCLSSDHSTLIGISFDVAQAAQEMWNHIERLVSCPENISLSVPGKKKKKKEKKVMKPQPLPPKSHISQPCCFQHVTSVDLEDRTRYISLQRYLSSGVTTRILPTMPEEI